MKMIKQDSIGIRRVYEDAVRNETLRTIFRPYGVKYEQLYFAGNVTELRVIARPGIDELGIPPEYTDLVKLVKITSFERRSLGSLTEQDFVNSYPGVTTISELIHHLGMIYNKPISEFKPNSNIVKICFEYV